MAQAGADEVWGLMQNGNHQQASARFAEVASAMGFAALHEISQLADRTYANDPNRASRDNVINSYRSQLTALRQLSQRIADNNNMSPDQIHRALRYFEIQDFPQLDADIRRANAQMEEREKHILRDVTNLGAEK